MTTNMRARLLATTLLAGGVAMTPAALAQTAVPAESAPQPADDAASEGETIVVTGSLISNPNLAQSSPVNVTTAEEITLKQSNVAEEVLREVPGIVPNIGSAVNNGNGGASFVDLRGLGANRNIVLLDGNRIVPSGLAGQVDLNNIPLALVERVDALTGGAATTYGADAVSGVVNFITRRDFAGAEISVGERITEKGDGNFFRADVTLGANFDDGRGNAVFSIGYQSSDAVYQGDRSFSVQNISSFTGAPGGSGTAVPSRFSGTRPLIAGTNTPNMTAPFTQTGVDAMGRPILVANAAGAANGGVRQVNAAGQGVAPFAPFNFNPYNIFQTPFERFNMFGAAHYEVTDGIEVYTRGLFSKNTVRTIIAPSGSFGGTVTIPLSNPYLPAALRAQFCAFNVAPNTTGVTPTGGTISGQTTYTPRFTPAECAAAAVATSPTDPNFRTVTATLGRRAVEVGPRITNFQTTIFDYRAGVRGDITDSIRFDVSGGYGESELITAVQNFTLQSRIRAAVFATNTTSCLGSGPNRNGANGTDLVAGINGCVPVNIFGPAGSITPNQIPFLTAESTSRVRTSLAQARAVINGDFGWTIPWATDPVSFAVGAEYRNYTAQQRADQLAQTPSELGGAGAAALSIDGGYDVYEALGELNIPIVADRPFFDSLSVEAGVRYSHYTVNAPGTPKFNTTTYKVGGTWAPIKDLKIRGGYAHSVRAPNIGELFAPVNTGLVSLAADPCAGAAPTTNANLRAVCLAQGAPAGTIGSITNPTAGQANVTAGGNINLNPETSNSYTVGAVIQPSFVPGFSATVDYYNISIKKAITVPTAGDAVNACFGAVTAASATDPNCTIIRRNPITGGLDGDLGTTKGLFLVLSNLGTLATDGIDVSLNYRRDIGFAKLSIAASGNYTFHSKFRANVNIPVSANSPNRECAGYYSTTCSFSGSLQPKWQTSVRTTLGFDDVDVSLLWRHIDAAEQEPLDITNGNGGVCGPNSSFGCPTPDFGHIPSFNYFDLALRFGISSNLDLTMNVANLFDKKPPIVGSTVGSTAFNSGNTYPSTYDALGRTYAVGAKLKF